MRPEHFVETKYIDIRTGGLHIDQPMRRVGNAVHAQAPADRMHTPRNLGNWIYAAQHIRRVCHRHPLCLRRQQRIQVSQFQHQAVVIHFPDLDNGTGPLQSHPAANIGFVIGIGDDNFIA